MTSSPAGASKAQALEERQRAAVRAPARTPQEEEDQAWRWWFALPLQPFGVRKTLREEIVPGQVWGFDQVLGPTPYLNPKAYAYTLHRTPYTLTLNPYPLTEPT